MVDAHGRSVFKTNKVNNCPVLNIYVFPYVHRDRGATLRFGGWVMTIYWGGTIHFFLLTLFNFKNIGGHVPPPAPLLRGPWFRAFILVKLNAN